jgi:hypothetical protein
MEPIVGQIPIPDAIDMWRNAARHHEGFAAPTWIPPTGTAMGIGTKDEQWAG